MIVVIVGLVLLLAVLVPSTWALKVTLDAERARCDRLVAALTAQTKRALAAERNLDAED